MAEKKEIKLVDKRLLLDIPEIDTHRLQSFVLDNYISQRLSLMYAYNPTLNKFIALRSDSFGQLLVAGISPSSNWNYREVNVDDTGTLIDFEAEYQRILVINDGPNDVFVAFNRSATTSDIRLKSGEYIELNLLVSKVGLICNASENATVRIIVTG